MITTDIRQLASGTMGTIMLDSCRFLRYQCQDYWWIDQVRRYFLLYAENAGKPFDTWQAAWHDYGRWYDHVRDHCWTCSYQGETDFVIDTGRYAVRWSGDPEHNWNTGVWESDIVPTVGTIHYLSNTKGFPPMKVVSAFPGIVPITATFEWEGNSITNWQWVYHNDFGKPETFTNKLGWLTARAFPDSDRITDWDSEPRSKRRAV